MNITPDKDNFWIGILIGAIVCLLSAIMFSGLLKLVQTIFHIAQTIQQAKMLLLGAGVNLLVMRYYILQKGYEKTAKGLILITLVIVVAFFVLLRDSSLTIF